MAIIAMMAISALKRTNVIAASARARRRVAATMRYATCIPANASQEHLAQTPRIAMMATAALRRIAWIHSA
jgi:hypothetical protein